MKNNTSRLKHLTHDALHHLARLYRIIAKAQGEANKVCERMFLDKQEVNNLIEMEEKEEANGKI